MYNAELHFIEGFIITTGDVKKLAIIVEHLVLIRVFGVFLFMAACEIKAYIGIHRTVFIDSMFEKACRGIRCLGADQKEVTVFLKKSDIVMRNVTSVSNEQS